MKKTTLLAVGLGVACVLAGATVARGYYPYSPQYPSANYGYPTAYGYPPNYTTQRFYGYGYRPPMQQMYRQPYRTPGYYPSYGAGTPYPNYQTAPYSPPTDAQPNQQPGRASVRPTQQDTPTSISAPDFTQQPLPDAGEIMQDQGSGTRESLPVEPDKMPEQSDSVLPENVGGDQPQGEPADDDAVPHFVEGEVLEDAPMGDYVDASCEGGHCERIYSIYKKPERIWVSAEYLLWFITDGPTIPLATTSADPAVQGTLNAPTTSVVIGANKLEYDYFNGGRAAAGLWFDDNAKIGLEGSGFLLEQKSDASMLSSTGTPLLAIPFQNLAGVENTFAVAQPAAAGLVPSTGSVALTSESQLWGADATFVLNLYRCCECGDCKFNLDLLGGFVYRDLHENLDFFTASSRTPGAADSFSSTSSDRFNTRNQFFGGHIGTRMKVRYWRLGMDLMGRVAFGSTEQRVSIGGASTFAGTGAFAGGAPATSSSGVYAQPSNIGQYSRDEFTVLPEGNIRFTFRIMDWLHAFVGYDAMYWGGVVRPGDQIDRTINAPGGIFVGGLQAPGSMAAPPSPAPTNKETNVWIHGVSFGVKGTF